MYILLEIALLVVGVMRVGVCVSGLDTWGGGLSLQSTVCRSWINHPYINVNYEKEKLWGDKNITGPPLAPGLPCCSPIFTTLNTTKG